MLTPMKQREAALAPTAQARSRISLNQPAYGEFCTMRLLWSGAPSLHQTSPLSPSARFISSTRWRALRSRSGSHLELRTCWLADPSCRTSFHAPFRQCRIAHPPKPTARDKIPPIGRYGMPIPGFNMVPQPLGRQPVDPSGVTAVSPSRDCHSDPSRTLQRHRYTKKPGVNAGLLMEQVRPFGRGLFLHQGATRLLRAGRMAYRFSHIELGFPKLTCEAGVQSMAHIGFRSTSSRLNRTCGSKAETHGQKNPPG